MKILINTGGIAETNCFVIADEQTRQAAMFDAPNDTTADLLDQVQREGWDLVGLWLTHGHFDHMADHKVVKGRFPKAQSAIHRLDAPKLANPNALFPLPFVIPPMSPDLLLEDGQKLKIGSLEFEVMHTPGHCAGHAVYYCGQEDVLVGGDLIIDGAVGRTDLPDSDEEQLWASIRRVMALPPETRLLPGHGPVGTLAEERDSNPYVQYALRGRS